MSLEKYIKKRDFTKTTEPKAGKKNSGKLKFVVQRHHASHLHYDFRLEMDGVLKSWAIPKGPSLNPKDKRLAMMVEDHPYDYRTFEGIIPEGNYGAGVVTIFDEGTYEPIKGKNDENELKQQLYSGNLKFKLHGKILKGEFALIKIKNSDQNAWLLIKHKDEFAVNGKFNSEDLVPEQVKKQGVEYKKKLPDPKNKVSFTSTLSKAPIKKTEEIPYKPMLAKLHVHIFDDRDWIYEKKLDGYRIIAYTGKNVKLISRNGIDYSDKYKEIQKALEAIGTDAVIDGELVIEDTKGKSSFQDIQNYDPNNKKTILKYYVFDLLALNGHDIRQIELIKRKELLKTIIKHLNNPIIVYNDHVAEKGTDLFSQAKRNGWEGIIAKNGFSTYESGKRSDSWQKFKLQNSQEAIICGFTKPAGSRKYIGSLILGIYDDANKLKYIGNCGSGFTEKSLKDLYDKLIDLKTDQKPVSEKVKNEKTATWIKPKLICEVTYSEWTQDGHLRHPVFRGIRLDKNPEEIQKELLLSNCKDLLSNEQLGKSNMSNEIVENFGNKKVKLTNLNKLYWKKESISKGDLLNYYRNIADYILPYLKDRPLSLNRYPNGIDEPGFFQKDLNTEQIPSWIKTIPLYSESNDKYIDYLICNNLPTLMYMVNLGCIEINPWLSTYKKPENPDFAVIDLDPQDIDFKYVIEAALITKDVMERMQLKPFIKTSGSRGLHIFVHLGAKYDYDLVKMFAEYVAKLIHTELPHTTSLERSPAKRKNLIYLDFLQNRRGQTIVAPYSVRPKPDATVSTPLNWDEVNDSLNPVNYTIFNTQDCLKHKGDLWDGIRDIKSDLKAGLKILKESTNR